MFDVVIEPTRVVLEVVCIPEPATSLMLPAGGVFLALLSRLRHERRSGTSKDSARRNLLLVLASLRVGGLILTEASLSFLGVGIPSRIPSWGQMISDGRDTLDEAWWISFFPGLGIFLTVMSMNFLGDWIRDRTDPRLRQLRD